SAKVRKEVTQLVNSYASTTTDHYPVQTSYNLHILGHPADVSSFNAVVDSGNVELTWSTDYEINTANYVVQRSRTQGNFSPVDTVAAHGTTAAASSYKAYDYSPWFGTSYYRLKVTGTDGNITYSNVKQVNVTIKDLICKLLWFIFGHQLQIWLDFQKTGPAELQLVDIQGRIRYQTQMYVYKGRNLKTLDISRLSNGVYFLRVNTQEGSTVTKILVSH
ncbi:MAG TPA: T9SS type A sorting domain-containing protein, partial [Chitinophaga sp.]|nr:T9SS type A sorting domain-containing protein [Chitinophaga sp.]